MIAPTKAQKLGGLLLLLLAAALLPALWNGFAWDDLNNLVISPRLHHWSAAFEVFRRPAMWSAELPQQGLGTYRPLALASFVLDHQMWGMNPAGYHLTSLVLHLLAQLAVFALLCRLTGSQRQAFALALLCGLHPTVVEAAVWINGRSELFALLFGAAAMLTAGRKARGLRSLAIGLLLLLAMLGKETGVVFVPLVLLVAARDPTGTGPGLAIRRALPAALGAAGAVAAYALLRHHALDGGTALSSDRWLTLLAALPAVWVHSLEAAIFPLDRSIGLVGPWLRALSTVERVADVVAVSALLALGGLYARRGKFLVVLGLSWWLMALFPVAALALLDWPGFSRWLYVGMPGLALAIHGGIAVHLSSRRRTAAWALAIAALVLQTERTIPVWRNDLRLFTTMVDEQPEQPWPLQQLGVALLNAGRPEEAASCLERALALGARADEVGLYLAVTRAQTGHCDEAVRLAQAHRSVLAQPGLFSLAAGRCYEGRGEHALALHFYRDCAVAQERCAAALSSLSARSRGD
ncbi:MAG: hypothetical protein EXR72_01285 [Myxococcales bacterium]|nr:hypothetical protein [Myxococcales bacterium]